MSDHLIVLSDRPGPEPRGDGAALRRDLEHAGWTRACSRDRLEVWTRGAWPVCVRPTPDGHGVIVGEVFERLGSDRPSGCHGDAERRAAEVVKRFWGAYVALWPGRGSGVAQILRDPSGAREALVWRRSSLLLAASRLSSPGLRPWLPRLSVNRDRLAHHLVDANEVAGPLALDGVEAVTAGSVWSEGRGEAAVWTPGALATRTWDPPREEAAAALRAAVDGVARSWGGLGRPLIAEISGGLDSAIMAASLAPVADVRRWLTFYGATAESDERVHARQVAAKAGVFLTELAKPEPSWDAASLAEMSGACRPPLGAMDIDYDRTIAAEGVAAEAWGVVTGQGGDSVFLNLRTPLIAGRLASRRARGSADEVELRSLAAWLRTNVRSVIRDSRRAARDRDTWPSWSPRLGASRQLHDLRRSGPRHPWLQTLSEVEPVKRLQVAGVVQSMLMTHETRRSRAARQIHLPLQQPVLELTLGLPADVLVFGGWDRALARTAFADRLPGSVAKRDGKGDLTALFGRALGRALPLLRERLLGGELRAMGLLDVPRLEARLQPEPLMLLGGYGDLMDLLAIETWAVDWRGSRPS